jgi:hypothetical protein
VHGGFLFLPFVPCVILMLTFFFLGRY